MDDHTLPLYTAEPRLPSYAVATSPTLSYTPSLTLSDTSFMSTNFVFTSKSAVLDLGPRTWGASTPVYGHHGLIEGTLDVKKIDTVHKIIYVLVGRATTTLVREGIPVAPQVITVLDHSAEVYRRSTETTVAEGSQRFQLLFELPELSGDDLPLPPSFTRRLPGTVGEITYEIQVDIYRRGWRSHETIKAPFLYLPRTAPPQEPQLVQLPDSADWKLREYLELDWETFRINRGRGTLVQFSLPRPLWYKSQARIFFTCTIASARLSNTNAVGRNLNVTLHRVISMRSLGRSEVSEVTLAEGDILQAKVDEIRGITIFFGVISGGRHEGEMAFRVSNSMEVKYLIRVKLTSVASGSGTFVEDCYHEQPITLTTHSWAELNHELNGRNPALGLYTR